MAQSRASWAGPTLGATSLFSQLIETFVNYSFIEYLSAGAYYGHSFGHDVIEGIFAERDDADYFFVDVTIRFP